MVDVEYTKGGVTTILIPSDRLKGSGLCGNELTYTASNGGQAKPLSNTRSSASTIYKSFGGITYSLIIGLLSCFLWTPVVWFIAFFALHATGTPILLSSVAIWTMLGQVKTLIIFITNYDLNATIIFVPCNLAFFCLISKWQGHCSTQLNKISLNIYTCNTYSVSSFTSSHRTPMPFGHIFLTVHIFALYSINPGHRFAKRPVISPHTSQTHVSDIIRRTPTTADKLTLPQVCLLLLCHPFCCWERPNPGAGSLYDKGTIELRVLSHLVYDKANRAPRSRFELDGNV